MTIDERLKVLADRVGKLESEVGLAGAHSGERRPMGCQMLTIATALDQIGARLDQLHLRADAVAGRIDVLQARSEARLDRLEVEIRELPGMIERGMRAALRDAAN